MSENFSEKKYLPYGQVVQLQANEFNPVNSPNPAAQAVAIPNRNQEVQNREVVVASPLENLSNQPQELQLYEKIFCWRFCDDGSERGLYDSSIKCLSIIYFVVVMLFLAALLALNPFGIVLSGVFLIALTSYAWQLTHQAKGAYLRIAKFWFQVFGVLEVIIVIVAFAHLLIFDGVFHSMMATLIFQQVYFCTKICALTGTARVVAIDV